jgi:uncharacterized membrane protein YgcG
MAMAELGKLSAWRHAAVGAAVLVCSGLALFGVIGEEQHDERFDAKQVTVTPVGENGLRIREVVDEDFGSNDRHGYQRIIPNDFGVPTDVSATSPDAPADVSVEQVPRGTRIRVGDPNTNVSGQHRFVLSYTLPDARLTSGELALDVIGTEETLSTGSFEVVVTGLQLEDPLCNVGAQGGKGGCTLEPDDGTYRAVISPLEPGQGITIGGTIVGRSDPVAVPEPPIPDRRSEDRVPLALAVLAIGAVAGAAVYVIARWRGRNEVFAGGAADAAFGNASAPGGMLPPPGTPVEPATPRAVRYVADQEMDELATTEFAPPGGIEPWQGTVLLRERIDDESIGAWFSGLAARDVITLTRDENDSVTLGVGDKFDTAAPADREVLTGLFEGRHVVGLGTYDKRFATAWREVRSEQEEAIAGSGWWKRHSPHASGRMNAPWPFFVVFAFWILIVFGSAGSAFFGWVSTPAGAILFGLVVPALAAFAVYRTLLPVRSATGSAFALRAESFRRFLKASEGRHVEWAWKQGLLREYSAWAVALGAADAWERAMRASSVSPAEFSTGPLLVYSMGPSWSSTYTAPSSPGGSGGFGGGGFSGGGFSGGSVGGGGGGGSSGSW